MSAIPSRKRAFFKYTSPDTALAILRSKTFRYSSPLKFNDPFDFQSGLHFDFDLGSLPAKIVDRIEQLATANEDPIVDTDDPWGKLILLIREKYPTHGFPRDFWGQAAAAPFNYLIAEIRMTQQKYQEHWWKTLLPGIRVFCVSEDRDNLLMWAHYTKDHTGVVFELRSLPEEDNPLSVAAPVIYTDRPPPFFTESEWINDILSLKRMNQHDLNKRYAYIKSCHWSYEREWRVWFPLASSSESPHFDCPIRPSELAGVYIGCRAEPKFVADVVKLTQSAFPQAQIYRAYKEETTYALRYEKI